MNWRSPDSSNIRCGIAVRKRGWLPGCTTETTILSRCGNYVILAGLDCSFLHVGLKEFSDEWLVQVPDSAPDSVEGGTIFVVVAVSYSWDIENGYSRSQENIYAATNFKDALLRADEEARSRDGYAQKVYFRPSWSDTAAMVNHMWIQEL